MSQPDTKAMLGFPLPPSVAPKEKGPAEEGFGYHPMGSFTSPIPNPVPEQLCDHSQPIQAVLPNTLCASENSRGNTEVRWGQPNQLARWGNGEARSSAWRAGHCSHSQLDSPGNLEHLISLCSTFFHLLSTSHLGKGTSSGCERLR